MQVEEELSRAAKTRRKELEKLMKSIKALKSIDKERIHSTFQTREPERRCFLTFDKLIVDDNVYIFNDLEGRVEKLPHKTNLSCSNLDLSNVTDAYNDMEYNFRYIYKSNIVEI